MEKIIENALKEALQADKVGEVPVGAVIFNSKTKEILCSAHNLVVSNNDPTAHAEILALRQAGELLCNYNLSGYSLFVTLEPCAMCAGAIINSRLPRVVYGAYDKRFGALGSVYSLHEGKLNHIPEVKGGVLEDVCARLLSEYFRQKRGK